LIEIINIIKIHRNSILTIKEVDTEVNAKKTMYIFIFCHQHAGKNKNVKVVNEPSKIYQNSNIWK
jgi:hypothetical protein